MKFLVPNYSCLQNPCLSGYRPQIPVFSVLNWICWTPHPPKKIPGYATACWITKATDTHTLYNKYCFSTTSMVARTRHKFTLHVHCLSYCGLECPTVRNYELYTVLTVRIMAVCVITPCCLLGSCQCFWKACCVHLNLLWRWKQQPSRNAPHRHAAQ